MKKWNCKKLHAYSFYGSKVIFLGDLLLPNMAKCKFSTFSTETLKPFFSVFLLFFQELEEQRD